ncbi:hypothetical protein EUBDOL_02166 [Amedibacillus dolichus DSM 3991]|uniref:Uncharacterized protein n=1 Tax=Amedibacillus dolichus DSM 3991 TaxID=428127 RepID=A8RET1_9FIRM|nr:hypothetical protein EUBDOL_02074 [Amedibacillus dolichus DSM 3991]EDP10152.1 hypothetical protein EUBDOL_02166 [Amedibacillus dolichus DSM 3991]
MHITVKQFKEKVSVSLAFFMFFEKLVNFFVFLVLVIVLPYEIPKRSSKTKGGKNI